MMNKESLKTGSTSKIEKNTKIQNNSKTMTKSGNKNNREIIIEILIQVLEEGRLSHLVIRDKLEQYNFLEKQDKAFINRVSEGTIERKITIDYIIDEFSKTKVKKMKPLIRELLRMSVYQIMYMESVPDSAVCNEAVKIAKKRGFSNLSGFVNGVLRNVSRNKDNIKYPDINKDKIPFYSVRYSVPEWLISSFIRDYGEDITIDMLDSMLIEEDKKVTVRINTSKARPDNVISMLEEQGIHTVESEFADNALIISGYDNIDNIEAFRKGYIQIQDISSMLVGQISGIKENMVCIDMCAAPGGKSMHMADLLNGTGMVYSRDLTDSKVKMIEENVARCGFNNITVERQDATVYVNKDDEKADIVIADVPCSGMGVLRKKTDIKYNISEDSVKELAKISQNILKNAVKYLKKGGILIFSTCTMNRLENDKTREWLINEMGLEPADFTEYLDNGILDIKMNRESVKKGYVQLFMNRDFDGFYISKFIKR